MNTYRLTYSVKFPVCYERRLPTPGHPSRGRPKRRHYMTNREFEAENNKQARIKAKAFLRRIRKKNPENRYEPVLLEMVSIIGTKIVKEPVEKMIKVLLD